MNEDQRIRERIFSQLNTQTDFANVEIAVKNGFVVIKYMHEHSRLKKNLEQISRHLKSVKAFLIDNDATDKPIEQTLAFRLIDALQQEFNMDDGHIIIEISNGQVYLEGTVSRPSRRSALGKTIWEVNGVKGICNLLKVPSEQYGKTCHA